LLYFIRSSGHSVYKTGQQCVEPERRLQKGSTLSTQMEAPFPKSTSSTEKCKRLHEVVSPDDSMAILINADPDAIASALALKRIFWRKAKRIDIYHINKIERADNLALIQLLNVRLHPIRKLKQSDYTKFAIVDSQPGHNEEFARFSFDIIIDHHPKTDKLAAQFIDIKEDYGANATILTEYLRAEKIQPSPRLATVLFYGVKTDTNNFVRESAANDINAFRYLYRYANLNIIKKIESSEMTKKTLSSFKTAMDNLRLVENTATIYMGKVDNADILVIVADFFMKMAEVTWSIVSGLHNQSLVVIFRNAGFRRDAGKLAQKMFGDLGSAGGHRSAARAEVPYQKIPADDKNEPDLEQFVLSRIKERRQDLV
jgi:nanoRNase/pAp phosphatase (c-di-AMP/oligoRNAs hydrolase)